MRSFILLILLGLVKVGLLANYKLYDSYGYALYDYSGNGRHDELWWNGESYKPD
jgi:hypothetical protein